MTLGRTCLNRRPSRREGPSVGCGHPSEWERSHERACESGGDLRSARPLGHVARHSAQRGRLRGRSPSPRAAPGSCSSISTSPAPPAPWIGPRPRLDRHRSGRRRHDDPRGDRRGSPGLIPQVGAAGRAHRSTARRRRGPRGDRSHRAGTAPVGASAQEQRLRTWADGLERLSPREHEVLRLLDEGLRAVESPSGCS